MWQERVAGEVEKIRSKNQERRQEDILRAWRGNRYSLSQASTVWNPHRLMHHVQVKNQWNDEEEIW